MRLLILTPLFFLGVSASADREGKLFLVTSTTSTTVSTTTSILQTQATCFALTAITKACRRKRMMMTNDPISKAEDTIEISRVKRKVEDSIDVDSVEGSQMKAGNRNAKFFWYYMTTTTTSTSTSTSTSLSYTATYSISLSGCTPAATFTACG
ncbi:uncharacterized protein LOC111702953 isoform X1 [Eurytemora carolleeae]|uniref:uncharacterized protein LOC111702953 isoform X1 n=1 Tax=Eurytemora carolleeae TaxID=1294199 RepID=UPI000C76C6A8|nr:uncharacterized protein LOC111702953 isoform X1 [Eurytemora carolleeae]|eukprot:XP_023330543.1 uncharacterized protein LOC111702953 isoform X1 [Eurytemora affinis]